MHQLTVPPPREDRYKPTPQILGTPSPDNEGRYRQPPQILITPSERDRSPQIAQEVRSLPSPQDRFRQRNQLSVPPPPGIEGPYRQTPQILITPSDEDLISQPVGTPSPEDRSRQRNQLSVPPSPDIEGRYRQPPQILITPSERDRSPQIAQEVRSLPPPEDRSRQRNQLSVPPPPGIEGRYRQTPQIRITPSDEDQISQPVVTPSPEDRSRQRNQLSVPPPPDIDGRYRQPPQILITPSERDRSPQIAQEVTSLPPPDDGSRQMNRLFVPPQLAYLYGQTPHRLVTPPPEDRSRQIPQIFVTAPPEDRNQESVPLPPPRARSPQIPQIFVTGPPEDPYQQRYQLVVSPPSLGSRFLQVPQRFWTAPTENRSRQIPEEFGRNLYLQVPPPPVAPRLDLRGIRSDSGHSTSRDTNRHTPTTKSYSDVISQRDLPRACPYPLGQGSTRMESRSEMVLSNSAVACPFKCGQSSALRSEKRMASSSSDTITSDICSRLAAKYKPRGRVAATTDDESSSRTAIRPMICKCGKQTARTPTPKPSAVDVPTPDTNILNVSQLYCRSERPIENIECLQTQPYLPQGSAICPCSRKATYNQYPADIQGTKTIKCPYHSEQQVPSMCPCGRPIDTESLTPYNQHSSQGPTTCPCMRAVANNQSSNDIRKTDTHKCPCKKSPSTLEKQIPRTH